MRSALQQFIRARLDGLPARPPRPKHPGTVPKPYTKLLKGLTLEQRFHRKVQQTPEGCWLWTGTRHTWMVAYQERNPVRWAYEHFTGNPVPDSCYLVPGCGHADCINPAHMQVTERNVNLRKLDAAQVQAIRQDQRSNAQVARDYGVVPSMVSMLKAGKRRAA